MSLNFILFNYISCENWYILCSVEKYTFLHANISSRLLRDTLFKQFSKVFSNNRKTSSFYFYPLFIFVNMWSFKTDYLEQ